MILFKKENLGKVLFYFLFSSFFHMLIYVFYAFVPPSTYTKIISRVTWRMSNIDCQPSKWQIKVNSQSIK